MNSIVCICILYTQLNNVLVVGRFISMCIDSHDDKDKYNGIGR